MVRRTKLGEHMFNKKNSKEQSWYTVYSFMTQELNLYGNLLTLYAIIHGYTMQNKPCNASYKYLRQCSNINSNSTISKSLYILENAGYITKYKEFSKYDLTNECHYKTNQTYDHQNKCFISKIEHLLSKEDLKYLSKIWDNEHKQKK